jgi:hypothetical protein
MKEIKYTILYCFHHWGKATVSACIVDKVWIRIQNFQKLVSGSGGLAFHYPLVY